MWEMILLTCTPESLILFLTSFIKSFTDWFVAGHAGVFKCCEAK